MIVSKSESGSASKKKAFSFPHRAAAVAVVALRSGLEVAEALPQREPAAALGAGLGGVGGLASGWVFRPVRKRISLSFECFPYICPEPVLVK
jgi:hypothetical protein